MLELFESARRVSVPILTIETADQAGTAEAIRAHIKEAHPVVQWDASRGITVVPRPDGTIAPTSKAMLDNLKVNGQKVKPEETVDFVDAMTVVAGMPRGSIIIVHNAHRQLMSSEPYTTARSVQSVANLRDVLKRDFRLLVLLGPLFVIPSELENDVISIKHALPGRDELRTIVNEVVASAKLVALPSAAVEKAVDALIGLSTFTAEQVTAMSLRQTGIDLDALWQRKRDIINQTRGLSVWSGPEKFSDLVGLDNVKDGLRQQIGAKMPVGVVVFMDEIDKVFANVEHDTSNVRMDQMRAFLTKMENNGWLGCVLMGVPGGGKSALAKAFGNEAGVPTIALDLGDMEAPHVGESEALLRHGIDVIERVGDGRAFLIATSNNASVMRPEMQRRFTEGVFFFDLMSKEERTAAWTKFMKDFDLPAQPLPDDEGWTGAEIRNCCRKAWNNNLTLLAAAKFIVPVALSRADEIERLRRYAHGRLLDANKPGTYTYEAEPMAKHVRAIALPGEAIQALQGMKES